MLGEGNNSAGELIPGMFAARGLENIQVALNDKASTLLPPYATPEQRAMADEMTDFARRDFWIWSREDTLRYFLAGGGQADEFEACWAAALAVRRGDAAALAEGTYACAGGAVCYLISGTKPANAA